jgi:hypothetical protein
MKEFEYIVANDFDRAWLNFELDLPLQPGKNGDPNPFYVNRPGNPIAELTDALLAPFYRPPKFYFSGHRGCGKSTELQHILANQEIQKKFWPINFSIRKEADIIDLDFRDVLLAIGSRLFRNYRESGSKLPEKLLKELDSWRGKVEEEVTTRVSSRATEYEVSAGLDNFFVNAGLKMKLEPATRRELRQVLNKNITGLIKVIDSISNAIYLREKRVPLVLIDDLDKPDLEKATGIFHDRREIMMQPQCAIVYTVSSALFYSKEFDAIRDQAVFLPNINLHPQLDPMTFEEDGLETMGQFVHQRMNPDLIDKRALKDAIACSGGVFREMARIMRSAIGRARRRDADFVDSTDIDWAATELRNEYRRILDKNDILLLKKINRTNRLEYNDRLRPLLQLLAILEYRNGDNWCDVHPVLRRIVDE